MVFVFHRLKIPAVVGLLVAGAIVGPYGLGLIGEVEKVELLAEVGVVVLLFMVGLEFSLSRLLAMWRVMVVVGLPQVLICVVLGTLTVRVLGGSFGQAIFAGMLLAMSSRAVVLKVLNDRGELGTPQGRLAVAVLLLQDLMVVLFMLSVPLLAPNVEEGESLGLALGGGLGVVALVLGGSRFLVTPLLGQVVGTRNPNCS